MAANAKNQNKSKASAVPAKVVEKKESPKKKVWGRKKHQAKKSCCGRFVAVMFGVLTAVVLGGLTMHVMKKENPQAYLIESGSRGLEHLKVGAQSFNIPTDSESFMASVESMKARAARVPDYFTRESMEAGVEVVKTAMTVENAQAVAEKTAHHAGNVAGFVARHACDLSVFLCHLSVKDAYTQARDFVSGSCFEEFVVVVFEQASHYGGIVREHAVNYSKVALEQVAPYVTIAKESVSQYSGMAGERLAEYSSGYSTAVAEHIAHGSNVAKEHLVKASDFTAENAPVALEYVMNVTAFKVYAKAVCVYENPLCESVSQLVAEEPVEEAIESVEPWVEVSAVDESNVEATQEL